MANSSDSGPSSMKRVVVGVMAALVLAAGNLAGGMSPADAAGKKGAPSADPQGLRLVVCYYLPWMC